MTKPHAFFRIICPIFILGIFLSKLAFGGGLILQKPLPEKSATHSAFYAESADSDEELSKEKMEFKDFIIAAHLLTQHTEKSMLLKADIDFILPLTHLSIPIQPPC